MFGNRDFWICIDEPWNGDLPRREISTEIPEPPESIQREYGIFYVIVVFGLIAAVIYSTKSLIKKFYGKIRKMEEKINDLKRRKRVYRSGRN